MLAWVPIPILWAVAAAPRAITLDEALALAKKSNLELRAGGLESERAADAARAARGELLPALRADDQLQEWDDGFAVSFGAAEPIKIRDQLTNSLVLSATEPLTGLASGAARWQAEERLADAARADLAAAGRDVEFRTTEAYLRVLEAADLQNIADQAIADIEEQARVARARVTSGTLIEADFLRTQVALAEARQARLRAEAQLGSTRAALASVVGLPIATELAPAPIDRGALPALPATLEEALRDQRRPEVAAAGARAEAARDQRRAAWIGLLPQISLVGAYQRFDGFGFIQPKNAAYIGGVLSWTFWDWGKQVYGAKAASARAGLAGVELERRRRDVTLEATQRYLDARAARASIDVAHSAVSQAEEATRVARALYESGTATTTELLDAQLSLERARVNDARVVFDYLVTYYAFTRAVGR
jgi:outer membrane protein TolC